jgi:hypothetical protein
MLKTHLGSQAVGEWLPLILGVVLMLVVLAFREGLLPGIGGALAWAYRRVRGGAT